jgi:hypothetical protein
MAGRFTPGMRFWLLKVRMGSIYSEISAYAEKDIISISSASGLGVAITS